MRIAIDALGLPPFGGARTSALGWLAALGRYDQENHYMLFVSSHAEEALMPFPNMEQRIIPLQNRFTARIAAQLLLPRLLAEDKADLLHSMKNLGVVGAPCPTIVTVNDLSHVVLRRLYPWADGIYWQFIQPRILRRARRVIAISENTRHDLMRWYGMEANRVVTLYPSCDERFRQPCTPEEQQRVREKYGLPQSLLLYVGGLGVHKNVGTLVQAFGRIAGEIPHGLVLVGGAHHTTSDRTLEEEVAALGLAERVWMLGSVPAEDLTPLYQLADLFVFASLNEGFGLVLLEAMACGTPVLAARTGSVEEVVGDCGRLVDDPLDVEGFAAAIVTLLGDRDGRMEMSAKGLERSRMFTWEETAKHTLALYREVVDEQG